MNAVSAGQWERYQSGGGHTANSHSTRSAVAVPIAIRNRFTDARSVPERREHQAERCRLLDRQGLPDRRNRERHVAGFDAARLGDDAIGPESARDLALAGGLHFDRLSELAAAAGPAEGDVAVDPEPVPQPVPPAEPDGVGHGAGR